MNNIVLVHGAFVDGSGWEGVYKILKRGGYGVSVVQNPTISLEGDVTATKWILATQDGPAILVGHSHGGAVITEVGNDPEVAGLVYITAFAPDKGESVATLNKHAPPGATVSPILPPQDGYLFQNKAKFPASFAADVDAEHDELANDQSRHRCRHLQDGGRPLACSKKGSGKNRCECTAHGSRSRLASVTGCDAIGRVRFSPSKLES